MGKIISMVSGKGGVGKTTAVANIGTAMAAAGKRILVVDADVGLRNLDIALGMQNEVVYDYYDVIQGECTVKDALIASARYPGLSFLPAPQSVSCRDIDLDKFREMIMELNGYFDYIIIDCAAGIDDSFKMCVSVSDDVVIITTPEYVSIRDADRVAGILENSGIKKMMMIINRVDVDMIKKKQMVDIDSIINTVAVTLIGAVPEDRNVTIANNIGKPIVLKARSRAGRAYINIAKRLMGEKVEIFKEDKKERS